MGDSSSKEYNTQLKRIVGTIAVLPLMCIFPLILLLVKSNHTMALPVTIGYFLLFLTVGIVMIFVVGQSLKCKHQGHKAIGWLNRLIYSLDDTYERWSGRN